MTSPCAGTKRRRLPAIQGFAAVQVAQDPGEPRSLPGESIRLRLAGGRGGRELILPESMPVRRLVELLVALEGAPALAEGKPSSLERGV